VASREEIIAFCDGLLDVAAFDDYGPNGLQVPGATEIERVATTVSAHGESIDAAVTEGTQLLLAHHGLFWDFHPRALSEQMASRLRTALGAGLNVAGYHLPLDAHAEIGNNALLCEALGFQRSGERLGIVKGSPIGVIGRNADGVPATELVSRVREACGQDPLVFAAGPELVKSIGIITGSAASEVHEAVGMGLDAFLTGEPAEHAMADAREGRIHFIAAGHYATETFGIRRLGDLVAERFHVEHRFLDIPNPV